MTSTVPIGTVVAHHIGGGWGQPSPSVDESEPAFVIRGTDIPRVATGDISTVPLRFHKPSTLKSRLLMPGDIVVEVSGGSKDQPVGRSLRVTDRTLAALGGNVICASFCKLVRIESDAAHPPWVYRLLQAAYADRTLSAFEVQSTGLTNLKWKPFLAEFFVELPDRSVQTSTSALLDLLDDLIENNGMTNSALAALRDLLLPELTAGGIDVSHLQLAELIKLTE